MGRYQEWLSVLAAGRRSATTSPTMWLATVSMVVGVLLLVTQVEPFRRWLNLDLGLGLLCFAPSAALGLVAGWLEHHRKMSIRTYARLVLAGNTMLQFFFAALIGLSSPPGSFALASLLVLTVASHAYMTRTTVRHPYTLVGTLVAIAAGFLMSTEETRVALFGFVGASSFGVAMLAGTIGHREHQQTLEKEELKRAVFYRQLNERVRQETQMSKRVLDLLRFNHDAGNVLSTVFLTAQSLEENLARAVRGFSASQTATEQAAGLIEQLDRLKRLINRGHEVANEMPATVPVQVYSTVEQVAGECRSLFPTVSISVAASRALKRARVSVQEGELGLRRIVENVVRNACEGNGREHARHVEIQIQKDTHQISIRCEDDGPGFAFEDVGRSPVPLRTTKQYGYGLGLYNVDQLLQASGGALVLENSRGGGARVDARFPAAPPASEGN